MSRGCPQEPAWKAEGDNPVAATLKEVIISPDLIEQLLATTTGTILDGEHLAVHVRGVLMTATLNKASSNRKQEPAAGTLAAEKPHGMRQPLTIRGLPIPLPKFSTYEDTQTPRELLDERIATFVIFQVIVVRKCRPHPMTDLQSNDRNSLAVLCTG